MLALAFACAAPPAPAVTLPLGDCSSEGSLGQRSDIVFCEPFETTDWYTHGFTDTDGRNAATASTVSRTQIVSVGCVSGNCLKVNMLKGETNGLSVKWHPALAGLYPEQLYLRYYIKLGPNWSPNMCDASGNITGAGGKFPGLSDERVNADSCGQCGNGGDPGDGINCWSMRAVYRGCDSGDGQACATKPGAIARFGSYLYFYGQEGSTGSAGYWDGDDWGQSTGNGGTCGSTPNNVYCGNGDGGVFYNDQWYLVEMFVKMNTPGLADGIIRGWVDGVQYYEKDNMIFRLPGNDSLHVRTVWLNVYKGGLDGNCNDSAIYLDQLVVAQGAEIGAWMPGASNDTTPPAPPRNVSAETRP
ncbi:MAG: polysaccharide lyase [Hyphomicrobiales bacterium]